MMNKPYFIISAFFVLSLYLAAVQADEKKKMTGMYSYMADAGLFLECGDNKKRLPVAMEGDNISLERAYLKNRYQPGKSLLVTIKGHLDLRPKMEGEGQQQVIIVDQFLSIHQQERCTGSVPPSSLTNTYWKFVELNGEQLNNIPAVSRDIYFIIRQDNLINGFSGCNKFSGNVSYTEEHIAAGPLMSTRKACPAMKLEATIRNLISKADSYHIKGESLEIYYEDNQGEQKTAKFIAIYF